MADPTSPRGDATPGSEPSAVAPLPVAESLLRQYELAVRLFDHELSRFWLRFYVFLVVELLLVPVLLNWLATAPLAQSRVGLIIASLLSLVFTWLLYRGLGMQKLMLRVGGELEKASGGALRLLRLTRDLSPGPLWFSRLLSVFLMAGFTLLWLVLWILLELR